MILNNKHLDRFESIVKRHFKHTFTAQQKDLIQGFWNLLAGMVIFLQKYWREKLMFLLKSLVRISMNLKRMQY